MVVLHHVVVFFWLSCLLQVLFFFDGNSRTLLCIFIDFNNNLQELRVQEICTLGKKEK
jgi:hypothetical protein